MASMIYPIWSGVASTMQPLLHMRSLTLSSPLLVGGKSSLVARTSYPSNADATNHSRIGGATMNMPSSNFSQNGLARIFGVDPVDNTEAPSGTTHKRTAIIAGTVCSIAGLAIIVAVGGYLAWRWHKPHTDPEQIYEKDGRAVEQSELQSNSTSEQPRQDGSP